MGTMNTYITDFTAIVKQVLAPTSQGVGAASVHNFIIILLHIARGAVPVKARLYGPRSGRHPAPRG
jgi:hypothetical protein